jgi:hypothetical protein
LREEYYIALAALSAMTLVATLKLTLTGRVTIGPEKKTLIVFHPGWLGPLVVMVPFVIGRWLEAQLSPLPWVAFADNAAKAGLWAGLLAGISVTTVELWIFWTTATALLCFTEPMSTAYEPIPRSMHKYFHLVNLIAGAFIVYKALTATPA